MSWLELEAQISFSLSLKNVVGGVKFVLFLKIYFESSGDKTWLKHLKFENFDKIQHFGKQNMFLIK